MAHVFKCDRCGTYFDDPAKKPRVEVAVNGEILVVEPPQMHLIDKGYGLHLCQSCTNWAMRLLLEKLP